MKTWIMALVLSLSLLPVVAAEEPAKGGAAPEMTAEQQAMLAEWLKYGTPGEHHAHLKSMEGTFAATSTMWAAPGAPPVMTVGESTNTLILGGRFLEQHYKSDFNGQAFEGLGLTGYDNYRQKYVGSWMDTMSTLAMTSEGTCDGAGKSFKFAGEYDDPVAKKRMKFRNEIQVKDASQHTFTMWNDGPDGKEFKALEIVYTRK